MIDSKEKKSKCLSFFIHVLLEETDVGTRKFEILLQQCFFFHEEEERFIDYFKKVYVPCTREWAYAYQQGAGINTNMYVETFHQVLKVVYLENKQNQRQSFERIRKLEKGKSTHRTKQIVKRHKMAKEMVDKGILPECVGTENSWRVQPQSRQQSYIVKMVMEECSCALKCTVCHACIYMYICSCADSHLHIVLYASTAISFNFLVYEQMDFSALQLSKNSDDEHDS